MSNPTANNVLVETLGSSLRYGGSALSDVPDLLIRIMEEQAWREFVTRRGQHVEYERFVDFMTAAPLAGLGADERTLRNLCRDNRKALDLLDGALQQPHGGDHSKSNISTLAKDHNPRGTSREGALRKLRKDAPELHAEVLDGSLSPHAAMVKAGFRPRTFTVRPDPTSAARTLRKHMSPDDLAALARLLTEEV